MAIEIKAVLFDYGCVLCLPQLESDLEAMAQSLNAPLAQVKAAYWNFRDDFDLGVTSGREYWKLIAERCAVTLSDEQARHLIELDNLGWSRPNHVMAEWAERLRKSGITTAIVSNMPTDIRVYLDTVPWLPGFDHYSYSCDLRSSKPDSKIYEHTLSSLNIDPSHALFIDDRVANVEAAKKLGIHGFVFTDAQDFHSYVQSIGLPELRFGVVV